MDGGFKGDLFVDWLGVPRFILFERNARASVKGAKSGEELIHQIKDVGNRLTDCKVLHSAVNSILCCIWWLCLSPLGS